MRIFFITVIGGNSVQDLNRKNGDSADNYTFTACQGRFEKFIGRYKLHNIKIMVKTASADTEGPVNNDFGCYSLISEEKKWAKRQLTLNRLLK